MIKNARSLLKEVKNGKFNRVKVREKLISKNQIIKFLKNIIKGYINNDNKDKEYSVKLKSIKSDLNNASKKTSNTKKYIKYLDDIKKISIDNSVIFSSSSSVERNDNDQKGSGHVNLPILLSKMYTNNSSKN